MATMKRRIVYLSDEEWDRITDAAKGEGITISAYIRNRLGLSPLLFRTAREIGNDRPRPAISDETDWARTPLPPIRRPTAKERQANRDAILRKINRGG